MLWHSSSPFLAKCGSDYGARCASSLGSGWEKQFQDLLIKSTFGSQDRHFKRYVFAKRLRSSSHSTLNFPSHSRLDRRPYSTQSSSSSSSTDSTSGGYSPSSSKTISKQFFDDDRWQADYLESLMTKAGELTLRCGCSSKDRMDLCTVASEWHD